MIHRSVPLVVLLGILAMPGPVLAGTPGYGSGQHQPDYGLHWLLDEHGPNPPFPAVTCHYGDDTVLDKITVRPPVAFANVAGGPRTQLVGWRLRIEATQFLARGEIWSNFAETSTVKKSATGTLSADFVPRTYTFVVDATDNDAYRVVSRLIWYEADGVTPEGRADHFAYYHQGRATGQAPWSRHEGCRAEDSGLGTRGSDDPPYGTSSPTGSRGPHWILDHIGPLPETPAATCTYREDGSLASIKARPPIMLARNKGAGIQQQDVAWKAVVQTRMIASSSWFTYDESPVTRKRATEVRWPDFAGKTVPVLATLPHDRDVRVVYQLTWYKGTTDQVAGSIRRWPYWYKVAGGTQYREEYCPSYVGLPDS